MIARRHLRMLPLAAALPAARAAPATGPRPIVVPNSQDADISLIDPVPCQVL